nr:olfactory receptor 54 [Mythimna separata]
MARSSASLQKKHRKLMKIVKRIVLVFYGFNYFDGIFIYLPHRVDVQNSYSMTLCVGLEPLTASPNREACLIILALQEITIMITALNYQGLLLFLIAHTAAMYKMLAYEMIELNENYSKNTNQKLARDTLSTLVDRHSLVLDVIDDLKSLYSVPLGVNFGSSAVIISLFFFLPIQEWLQFMPVLVYCFLVFFLYCFVCQWLINCSELFERSVYCCGWENFDLKEKKLVFVMLRQSQKPVELLAADIVPVNIYTFATTLRGMFKFITVFKF